MAAVARQCRDGNPKGRIVATYDYTDADGTLLYQVLRSSRKDFRQRRPDGNGGWTWKLDERRVLYRWPELLKFPDGTVFVCEGEKDADRVASLGHCATTVAAGKWTDECVKALAGRDVIILEDNDDAGRKKALAAAQALHGTAKTIRIVSLPDLPDKGDVSDWLDADPRRAEKLAMFVLTCRNGCLTAARQATPSRRENRGRRLSQPPANLPLPFINIAAWQDQPVPEREWTVRDRIPRTTVTLLSRRRRHRQVNSALHLSTWPSCLAATGWAPCRSLARRSSSAARTTPTSCGAGSTEFSSHYNVSFGNLPISKTCTCWRWPVRKR